MCIKVQGWNCKNIDYKTLQNKKPSHPSKLQEENKQGVKGTEL